MAGPTGIEPVVTVLETVGLPINRWTQLNKILAYSFLFCMHLYLTPHLELYILVSGICEVYGSLAVTNTAAKCLSKNPPLGGFFVVNHVLDFHYELFSRLLFCSYPKME